MPEGIRTGAAAGGTMGGWIKAHERGVLLAVVGLQLAFLVAMIVKRALPLWIGDTILLRVEPLDPRDMFRGDYVILGYEMSRMSVPELPGERRGQPVYVGLEREADGRHWRPVLASLSPPPAMKYIKGRHTPGGLRFGIEAFYVQEGAGLLLEQAVRDRQVSAVVALAPWGQAALRRLVVEEPGGDGS
jgi:uncharacterized membrane-anchored protein